MKYPTETTHKSPFAEGSPEKYKSKLATEFPASIFSPDVSSKIYKNLALTVDAIEQGKKEGWFYNTASQDLSNASIALLENYRKEIAKIKAATHLSTVQKDEEIEKIFAEMKILRRANSGQKTKTWANEFRKALFKDVTSLTVAKELLIIAAFVFVGFVFGALLSMGVLGPFAPFAMPLLIIAAVCTEAYRLGSAIWNACTTANKIVNVKKAELGKDIIQDAAIMAEHDLDVATRAKHEELQTKLELELKVPLELVGEAQKALDLAIREKQEYEKAFYKPMTEMQAQMAVYDDALLAKPKTEEGRKLLADTMNPKSSGKKITLTAAQVKIAEMKETLLSAFVLKKGSPKDIDLQHSKLLTRVTTCKDTLQAKQEIVQNIKNDIQQEFIYFRNKSAPAQAATTAQARVDRSEGKGAGSSMKDILAKGREAKAATSKRSVSSSNTSDGSTAPTKKL